jgi:predicted GNAT family acetyltransferase
MAETVRDNVEHHRYELTVGDAAAISVYRRSGKVTTFVHTDVPASLGGRGIGSTLIRAALDMERASGRKVIAECPFVARFIEQHADYQDLLAPAAKAEAEHKRLDEELDEALEESFPASDPPAVTPRR